MKNEAPAACASGASKSASDKGSPATMDDSESEAVREKEKRAEEIISALRLAAAADQRGVRRHPPYSSRSESSSSSSEASDDEYESEEERRRAPVKRMKRSDEEEEDEEDGGRWEEHARRASFPPRDNWSAVKERVSTLSSALDGHRLAFPAASARTFDNYQDDRHAGFGASSSSAVAKKRKMNEHAKAAADTWGMRVEQLRQYKERTGSWHVKVKDDEKLAAWVRVQRYLWRKGSLSEQRKRILDDMGFVWTSSKGRANTSPQSGSGNEGGSGSHARKRRRRASDDIRASGENRPGHNHHHHGTRAGDHLFPGRGADGASPNSSRSAASSAGIIGGGAASPSHRSTEARGNVDAQVDADGSFNKKLRMGVDGLTSLGSVQTPRGTTSGLSPASGIDLLLSADVLADVADVDAADRKREEREDEELRLEEQIDRELRKVLGMAHKKRRTAEDEFEEKKRAPARPVSVDERRTGEAPKRSSISSILNFDDDEREKAAGEKRETDQESGKERTAGEGEELAAERAEGEEEAREKKTTSVIHGLLRVIEMQQQLNGISRRNRRADAQEMRAAIALQREALQRALAVHSPHAGVPLASAAQQQQQQQQIEKRSASFDEVSLLRRSAPVASPPTQAASAKSGERNKANDAKRPLGGGSGRGGGKAEQSTADRQKTDRSSSISEHGAIASASAASSSSSSSSSSSASSPKHAFPRRNAGSAKQQQQQQRQQSSRSAAKNPSSPLSSSNSSVSPAAAPSSSSSSPASLPPISLHPVYPPAYLLHPQSHHMPPQSGPQPGGGGSPKFLLQSLLGPPPPPPPPHHHQYPAYHHPHFLPPPPPLPHSGPPNPLNAKQYRQQHNSSAADQGGNTNGHQHFVS